MRANLVLASVISVVTVPVVVLGLLDPLEGGLAMLVAGALILATWLIGRVPVPRLEWIGWLAAFASGAAAIVGAGIYYPQEPVAAWVWVLAGLYELSVLVTLVGSVMHAVRHIRRHRDHRASTAVPAGG